ncbi:MAG: membrane protein insertion efficiency factor YidD [Leptospiraceae bacterium]|nr:membrane protein insertion efficiency factor YidD [Leptospiraceae bacterium]
MNKLAILFIRLYQNTLGQIWPGRCRFAPSCSYYAIECYDSFGFFKASWKSAWRILRCNPLSEGYFDPVHPEDHPDHQTVSTRAQAPTGGKARSV